MKGAWKAVAWIRALFVRCVTEVADAIKRLWPNIPLKPIPLAATLIVLVVVLPAGAVLIKYAEHWFGPPESRPAGTSAAVPKPSPSAPPPSIEDKDEGKVVVEVPALPLADSYHRPRRGNDSAGLKQAINKLRRACMGPGEGCLFFEEMPLSYEEGGSDPRSYSVPTFIADSRVAAIEDFCLFPGRQAAWALIAPELRPALARLGIDPRRRDAAALLLEKSRQNWGDQLSGNAERDWVQRSVLGVAMNYTAHGHAPALGSISSRGYPFRAASVPKDPAVRAREVVAFLSRYPRPARDLWAQDMSVVIRNERSRAMTVTGITLELISYGGNQAAQGSGPDISALALPRRIPLAGTDRFRIDDLLQRKRGPAATNAFEEPLNLEPGQPMRRKVSLQSDAGGFFVWRIGFVMGDGETVWGPERCHFAFPPAIE